MHRNITGQIEMANMDHSTTTIIKRVNDDDDDDDDDDIYAWSCRKCYVEWISIFTATLKR